MKSVQGSLGNGKKNRTPFLAGIESQSSVFTENASQKQ